MHISLGTALPQDHGLTYLVIAGVCLLIAMRFLRTAIAPIGQLIQVVAAVAVVALAMGAALVFVTAAAFSGR